MCLKIWLIRKIDEIAAVPAAPPSKLSKKFIELHIPTTHRTVREISTIVDPVGFPILSDRTKHAATTIPAMVCAKNLGSGGKFVRSSHKPTIPIANAGAKTEVANRK